MQKYGLSCDSKLPEAIYLGNVAFCQVSLEAGLKVNEIIKLLKLKYNKSYNNCIFNGSISILHLAFHLEYPPPIQRTVTHPSAVSF
jgi:hypothetical protein